MASLTPNQSCLKLAGNLEGLPPRGPDRDSKAAFEEMLATIRGAVRSPSSPYNGVSTAARAVTTYFHRALQRADDHGASLCAILADTTRDVPFWRPLFGLGSKPKIEQNRLQTGSDSMPRLNGSIHPDCVLEVARRVLTNPWTESSSGLVRSALRLIANCCADNNVNRSVIVRRGGIELMMHLARWRRECDLLIPTLFNVCVDYDEPAVDAQGEPWKGLDTMKAQPDQDASPVVNAAEQRLGMWWEPSEAMTSVENLLDAADHAENCLSTLADLVEMASRVSLFGINNLVRHLDGSESDELVEASTIRLIHALLNEGSKLATRDPECAVSICQATMNVLSQKATRGGLVSVEDALWHLIGLPYLCRHDVDAEVHENLQPYKKIILKLVYEVSSLETYGKKFNPSTKLIWKCSTLVKKAEADAPRYDLYPYASSLVLLANSIVSTDRAIHLLQIHDDLVRHLVGLVKNVRDADIVHPTIDLATRLALCAEGQEQLFTAGLLRAVQHILEPTSEANAPGIENQRDTVSLIRLLVKGKQAFLTGSEGQRARGRASRDLMSTISHLFHQTTDAGTKVAIGRLYIEILRTVASSAPTSNPEENARPELLSQSPDQAQPSSPESTRLERQLQTIFSTRSTSPPRARSPPSQPLDPAAPIAFIVTQAQADAAQANKGQEAEAWFGLGLLSTFPAFHAHLLRALAADEQRLLQRLRSIVAENSRPSGVAAGAALAASVVSTASSLGMVMLDDAADTTRQVPQSQQDPRFANVKVLVVRMMQSQALPQAVGRGEGEAQGDLKAVQDGLESVAAELGADWVLV